jgi:DNA-binding CsgD family transcriptional regulator
VGRHRLRLRCRRRGRQGRGRHHPALSRREREVAELVARGATNQSIADTLFLSVKTVESHLRNIFAKAGVSSRDALAAAVNRAARSGDAA